MTKQEEIEEEVKALLQKYDLHQSKEMRELLVRDITKIIQQANIPKEIKSFIKNLPNAKMDNPENI